MSIRRNIKGLTPKKNWDESQLLKECRRGNEAAQKALYDSYSAKMLGVCYRYVHNKPDAEDILQEGFIKVFTALNQFQSKGSLEGWIRRIMVNTAINFLNKNKKLREQLDTDDINLATVESADSALHQQDILSMMEQLPKGYRTIINLYAIEGYSHKEIGKMLDIEEVTSRSQYARGKKMLQKIQVRYEKTRVPNSEEEEDEGE